MMFPSALKQHHRYLLNQGCALACLLADVDAYELIFCVCLFPDLMRSTSSQISYDQQARGAGEQQMDRSNSLSERQKSLHSTGMTSTQSEPDLLKAYEAALRSED